jgi:hypothetical protein
MMLRRWLEVAVVVFAVGMFPLGACACSCLVRSSSSEPLGRPALRALTAPCAHLGRVSCASPCCRLPQVLRPPAPPCQELQEEEVRPHRTAAPQEEVEVNHGLFPGGLSASAAAAARRGSCWRRVLVVGVFLWRNMAQATLVFPGSSTS